MKRPPHPVGLRSVLIFCFLLASSLLLRPLYNALFPVQPLYTPGMFSESITDRNGELLRLTLAADGRYRVRLPLNEFPDSLKKAILLKEDRYFYVHSGVNPVALGGAFFNAVFGKGRERGASTITMQLVRLIHRLDTRTVTGKLRQMALAVGLERTHTKDEILDAYLNLAPCGYNIEGFGAASLIYFKKRPLELSLSEVLTLCVIPQNPSACAPGEAPGNDRLLAARRTLFSAWCAQYPDDRRKEVEFDLPARFDFNTPFLAPHYTDSLLKKGAHEGEVRGTIDLARQSLLEGVIARYTERHADQGIRNAAALLVDYRSMDIRALTGSADFFDDDIEGQVDGTAAKRSPGSTVKPFIYALAMDQGKLHPMTMLKDAPADFSSYHPDNFDGDFHGPVKARDALNLSRNIPAVYVASLLKNPDLYDFLAEGGVTDLNTKSYYGLAVVLGGVELTMRELVTLYALLANDGVLRAVNDEGEAPPPTGVEKRLLSREACFMVLSMLEENRQTKPFLAARSPGTEAPVYWKTGTSIGFKDAWTVGIFDQYVLAVWVGNFNGEGNPAFTGSHAAAPLFFDIVTALRRNGLSDPDSLTTPVHTPPGVTKIEVCAISGQIPKDCCPHRVWTWFIPGLSPIEPCTIHREINVDRRTGLRRWLAVPGITETVTWEFWPSDLSVLFTRAGLSKKSPPPFAPGETFLLPNSSGLAPEIISPLSRIAYVTRPRLKEYGEIPLTATADADAGRLFWFLNGRFVGESRPETPLFWTAVPGTYHVRCVDDHGRSDETALHVISAD